MQGKNTTVFTNELTVRKSYTYSNDWFRKREENVVGNNIRAKGDFNYEDKYEQNYETRK